MGLSILAMAIVLQLVSSVRCERGLIEERIYAMRGTHENARHVYTGTYQLVQAMEISNNVV